MTTLSGGLVSVFMMCGLAAECAGRVQWGWGGRWRPGGCVRGRRRWCWVRRGWPVRILAGPGSPVARPARLGGRSRRPGHGPGTGEAAEVVGVAVDLDGAGHAGIANLLCEAVQGGRSPGGQGGGVKAEQDVGVEDDLHPWLDVGTPLGAAVAMTGSAVGVTWLDAGSGVRVSRPAVANKFEGVRWSV